MLGGRRATAPRSVLENERLITRAQGRDAEVGFGGGMYGDSGAACPRNGVRRLRNYIAFNDRLQTRNGCRLWSETDLPASIWQGNSGRVTRSGMTIRKTGTTVTYISGAVSFAATDVGKYIVRDNGKHDRIVAYTNYAQVTVDNAEYTDGGSGYEQSTAAWMRDPVNSHAQHPTEGCFVIHIGNRVFRSDTASVGSWTEMYCIGPRAPADAKSTMVCYKQWVYLFTSNGIFRADMEKAIPLVYQANGMLPTERIDDQNITASGSADTVTYPFMRRYWYGLVRLSGQGRRNRMTPGVAIECETPPCKPDVVAGTYKDFGTVHTAKRPSKGDTTYGVLTGAAMNSSYNTVAEWEEIDDAEFRLTVNGTTELITIDFSGVASWADVAKRIQDAAQVYFPSVIVEWDATHFVFTAGNEGDTITYTQAGDGGTDIGSEALACESGTGTITNPQYGEVVQLSTLALPQDEVRELYECQYTHYAVYCSLDLGVAGYDPITGTGNNTELAIWLDDVEIGRAFTVTGDGSGAIAGSENGLFHQHDIGAWLYLADGQMGTILYLCDATGTRVYTETSQWVMTDYTGSFASQSAAIGDGDIITVEQSGQTVSITAGSYTFDSSDLGRPIRFEGDNIDYIIAILSSTQCQVTQSLTRASCAATLNSYQRGFGDFTTDETLRARIRMYAMRNRFWSPLPICNIGDIGSGWLFVGGSGDTRIYYGQMPQYFEYLAGYHRVDQQAFTFERPVADMKIIGSNLVVVGRGQTYGVPIGSYYERTVDELGEKVFVLPSWTTINASVGGHRGGICAVDNTMLMVVTDEPGLRLCDGTQYGANLIEGRCQDEWRKLLPIFCVGYDPIPLGGAYVWGLDEVED